MTTIAGVVDYTGIKFEKRLKLLLEMPFLISCAILVLPLHGAVQGPLLPRRAKGSDRGSDMMTC